MAYRLFGINELVLQGIVYLGKNKEKKSMELIKASNGNEYVAFDLMIPKKPKNQFVKCYAWGNVAKLLSKDSHIIGKRMTIQGEVCSRYDPKIKQNVQFVTITNIVSYDSRDLDVNSDFQILDDYEEEHTYISNGDFDISEEELPY